ncbi:hypothetical protein BH10BDE1_BH10BDE1_03320 [soil metagenome]
MIRKGRCLSHIRFYTSLWHSSRVAIAVVGLSLTFSASEARAQSLCESVFSGRTSVEIQMADLTGLGFLQSSELGGALRKGNVFVKKSDDHQLAFFLRTEKNLSGQTLSSPAFVFISTLDSSARIIDYQLRSWGNDLPVHDFKVDEKNVTYSFFVLEDLQSGGANHFHLKPHIHDAAELTLREAGHRKIPKTAIGNASFRVGEVNSTDDVRTLVNIGNASISHIESAMRAGGLATSGFLGKNEKLIDVLITDNELVLEKLKTTHQRLAEPLLMIRQLYRLRATDDKFFDIVFHGDPYRVQVKQFMGNQVSPFFDRTASNLDFVVTNLRTHKSIAFSGLVPDMIERYGFYEGNGVPYRVNPQNILEVFEYLRARN